jgi:hypothetical protein
MNSLSALALGAYLLTVAFQGNASKLLDALISDKPFLKWFFALLILFYMRKSKLLGKDFSLLISMAFIGLFITSGDKITAGFKNVWSYLGVQK